MYMVPGRPHLCGDACRLLSRESLWEPKVEGPVGLGEVEEDERQFPGQPEARSRDPAPGRRLSLVTD